MSKSPGVHIVAVFKDAPESFMDDVAKLYDVDDCGDFNHRGFDFTVITESNTTFDIWLRDGDAAIYVVPTQGELLWEEFMAASDTLEMVARRVAERLSLIFHAKISPYYF